jgi:hypothetical protein
MEYSISDISKIKIGDILILDIDPSTGGFPDIYADLIKKHSELLKAEMAAYVYSKELKIRLLFKDENFKKIGVVVDNYKLAKAKSLLMAKGFLLLEIAPLINNTSAIKFDVPLAEFEKKKAEVSAVINIVEAHFKRSN